MRIAAQRALGAGLLFCIGSFVPSGVRADPASTPAAPDASALDCPTLGGCSKQNGLVALYLFEEFSAGQAPVPRRDCSPFHHDLSDPKWVASTAAAHSGSYAAHNRNAGDDYLTRADSPSLSVFHGERSFTVAAWFQIVQEPASGGRILITKGTKVSSSPVREWAIEHQSANSVCQGSQSGTDHLHFAIYGASQSLVLDVPNTSVDPNGFDPSAAVGAWQFVMAWHDRAQQVMAIQINGGAVFTLPTGGLSIPNTSAPLVIGGKDFGTGKNWDGYYDDIAIWNRVLTPGERSSVFDNGLFCP